MSGLWKSNEPLKKPTAARQTEIDSLRDLLRQELSTSEDAALAQRSDITKALEGRIADMQKRG